jgi:hypothetical protein
LVVHENEKGRNPSPKGLRPEMAPDAVAGQEVMLKVTILSDFHERLKGRTPSIDDEFHVSGIASMAISGE